MWTPFLAGNMAVTFCVFSEKLFRAELMQREGCCVVQALWLAVCSVQPPAAPSRYPRHRLTWIVASLGPAHLAGLAAKQREGWDRTHASGSGCSFQGPINPSFPSPECSRLSVEMMQGNSWLVLLSLPQSNNALCWDGSSMGEVASQTARAYAQGNFLSVSRDGWDIKSLQHDMNCSRFTVRACGSQNIEQAAVQNCSWWCAALECAFYCKALPGACSAATGPWHSPPSSELPWSLTMERLDIR